MRVQNICLNDLPMLAQDKGLEWVSRDQLSATPTWITKTSKSQTFVCFEVPMIHAKIAESQSRDTYSRGAMAPSDFPVSHISTKF